MVLQNGTSNKILGCKAVQIFIKIKVSNENWKTMILDAGDSSYRTVNNLWGTSQGIPFRHNLCLINFDMPWQWSGPLIFHSLLINPKHLTYFFISKATMPLPGPFMDIFTASPASFVSFFFCLDVAAFQFATIFWYRSLLVKNKSLFVDTKPHCATRGYRLTCLIAMLFFSSSTFSSSLEGMVDMSLGDLGRGIAKTVAKFSGYFHDLANALLLFCRLNDK